MIRALVDQVRNIRNVAALEFLLFVLNENKFLFMDSLGNIKNVVGDGLKLLLFNFKLESMYNVFDKYFKVDE